MANTTVNKVVLGNETLIDLTPVTVTSDKLASGYTALDASGALITGTASGGSMVIRDEADSHGGTIRHITAGSVITGTVEITENGTYDVAQYADASVNVPAPEPELQAKSATPSETAQTITPDSGYDGLSQVNVGAISGTYVGSQVPRFTLGNDWVVAPTEEQSMVMADGEYLEGGDIYIGAISSTYVGSGITRRSSSDLTASGATVTVPGGYYSSSASKAVSSGSATAPASISGTSATVSTGTNTLTLSKTVSVTPSVTAGYVSSGTAGNSNVSLTASVSTRSSSSLTVSGDTVTAPAGYYASAASKAVAAGTAGTPTATKGTVSNHSVSVTPSVTNATGYITGSTKTGTAVTVSASELVSGSQTITESGTVDVTNLAEVVVEVPSSGPTITISGTGNSSCYVRLNNDPPSYYTDGSVIPFADGDELYMRCAGRQGGGTITVNGVVVATDPYSQVSYVLPLPICDITVDIYYSSNGRIDVTIPSIRITDNGTHDVSHYGLAVVEVASQSASGSMSDPIRFFDYDGTLVASYSAAPASLPSVPAHTGLTNGTWNYTLAQVQTQFNAMGTCDVGANYDTVSGATEIDIELQPERLHPYLSLAVNGTITIDWGDNSTDTATGTSLSSRETDIHHEYASAGSYTIKITKTSGTGYSLYCSSAYMLLNKNDSSQNNNRVYANCVKAARVGDDCTLGNYAFNYCGSLESVSIPSSITSIAGYSFYYCYSLKFVSIPSGATSTGSNAFNYCYSLASVSIPSTVTTISTSTFASCYSLASVSIPSGATTISGSAFQTCYSLMSVSIPSGVTSIGNNVFTTCQSLTSVTIPSGVTSISNSLLSGCVSLASSVTIPSGVTSIGTYAFSNCCGVTEYHFLPTTPPTLANTNAFTNIPSDCTIYVPAASLNTYKTANNWSTYASYMVGE